jgi:hypothetical protein
MRLTFSFTPRFSEVTAGAKFDFSRFNGFSSETVETVPGGYLACVPPR